MTPTESHLWGRKGRVRERTSIIDCGHTSLNTFEIRYEPKFYFLSQNLLLSSNDTAEWVYCKMHFTHLCGNLCVYCTLLNPSHAMLTYEKS